MEYVCIIIWTVPWLIVIKLLPWIFHIWDLKTALLSLNAINLLLHLKNHVFNQASVFSFIRQSNDNTFHVDVKGKMI